MSSTKRPMGKFFEDDVPEFEITRKYSVLSMETNDSISKEVNSLSPLCLKAQPSEQPESPENHRSAGREKLSVMRVTSSHKKKHRSTHFNSYQEIIKIYMSDPAFYVDSYKAIKYKNYKYSLDSFLLIRNEADASNDFVCKLLRIIKPNKADEKNEKKILAFLEVQWYYKKDDLPKKFAPFFQYLSASEVFPSSHKDFIMVDCINGPCQILSYDEYDTLSDPPPNVYFSRANYDVVKKKLDPPVDKWPKHCICKTPLNPDLLYVLCDGCNIWYHVDCIGVSIEEAEAAENYFCKSCKVEDKEEVKDPKTNSLSNSQEHSHKKKRKNKKDSHSKSSKKHEKSLKDHTETEPSSSSEKAFIITIPKEIAEIEVKKENVSIKSDQSSTNIHIMMNSVKHGNNMLHLIALRDAGNLLKEINTSEGGDDISMEEFSPEIHKSFLHHALGQDLEFASDLEFQEDAAKKFYETLEQDDPTKKDLNQDFGQVLVEESAQMISQETSGV